MFGFPYRAGNLTEQMADLKLCFIVWLSFMIQVSMSVIYLDTMPLVSADHIILCW
jgi:hypothetical protein